MYRKLLPEQGDLLVFFRTVYYWTETLACPQRIPTAFPLAAAGSPPDRRGGDDLRESTTKRVLDRCSDV